MSGPDRTATCLAPRAPSAGSGLGDRTTLLVVGALLAFLAASRLSLLRHPISFLDDRSLLDDTYIYLTLARNIAGGLGPWFETNYTNGFQPLYAFLIVPFFLIWRDDPLTPLRAALVLLTLCELLTLFFAIRLALRLGARLSAVVLAAVAWIVNPFCVQTTLSGMETMLACCLTVYCWDIYYRDVHLARRLLSPLRAGAFGAALGLAILARIDALLLAPVFLFAALWHWRVLAIPARAQFGRVALSVLALLAVCLPWLIYSFAYTGSIVPVSGRASRLQALFTLSGEPDWLYHQYRVAFSNLFAVSRFAIALWVVAAVVLVVATRRRGMALLRLQIVLLGPMVLWLTILTAAYAGLIHSSWYFERYLFCTLIASTVACALAVEACVGRLRPRLRLPFVALLAVATVAVNVQLPLFRVYYSRTTIRDSGYMPAAHWVARRFEPGTVIGSTQAGAFSYFAPGLTVVNLDGVVNRAAYDAMRDRRLVSYMREMNIAYTIEWPRGLDLIATSSSAVDAGFKVVDEIPVSTWGFPWFIYETLPAQPAAETAPPRRIARAPGLP